MNRPRPGLFCTIRGDLGLQLTVSTSRAKAATSWGSASVKRGTWSDRKLMRLYLCCATCDASLVRSSVNLALR
eukprot:6210766-Pleurochrysis_carterae.AAC.3